MTKTLDRSSTRSQLAATRKGTREQTWPAYPSITSWLSRVAKSHSLSGMWGPLLLRRQWFLTARINLLWSARGKTTWSMICQFKWIQGGPVGVLELNSLHHCLTPSKTRSFCTNQCSNREISASLRASQRTLSRYLSMWSICRRVKVSIDVVKSVSKLIIWIQNQSCLT